MSDAPLPLSKPFNVKRVSPSRIGKMAECGLAFKFHYIDRVPAETIGSAALFGTVVHKAREDWVVDRTQSLPDLMERAWRTETQDEPSIRAFITEYQAVGRRARALEQEIRARRPDIKMVRRTKDWTTSQVAADIEALIESWLPRLNEGRYRFTDSDPLPALYDESKALARKYQARWGHLPNALHAEFGFEFDFHGYSLNGRIDEIGLLLDKDSGEILGYGIEDAKTYKQAPHVFRDSRQLAIYDAAVRHYVAAGVLDLDVEQYPVYPVIDLMRLQEKVYYPPVQASEHKRLLAELRQYERAVKHKVFLPAAKSCKADFCDYAANCAFHHGNQGRTVELNVA